MTKIISFIAILFCGILTAQTSFDKEMNKALQTWNEGKTKEAITQLEKIALVEKTNWLPNYYIATIHTFEALNEKDNTKIITLLEAAQKAQDKINTMAPENAEVLVMQAMIHMGWIISDPMTNGQKLSGDVLYILNKAYQIQPENPRVVFQKALFEIGMAEYFGQDTKVMCSQIEKSIALFATFKAETSLHPSWGLEKAQENLKKCKL